MEGIDERHLEEVTKLLDTAESEKCKEKKKKQTLQKQNSRLRSKFKFNSVSTVSADKQLLKKVNQTPHVVAHAEMGLHILNHGPDCHTFNQIFCCRSSEETIYLFLDINTEHMNVYERKNNDQHKSILIIYK